MRYIIKKEKTNNDSLHCGKNRRIFVKKGMCKPSELDLAQCRNVIFSLNQIELSVGGGEFQQALLNESALYLSLIYIHENNLYYIEHDGYTSYIMKKNIDSGNVAVLYQTSKYVIGRFVAIDDTHLVLQIENLSGDNTQPNYDCILINTELGTEEVFAEKLGFSYDTILDVAIRDESIYVYYAVGNILTLSKFSPTDNSLEHIIETDSCNRNQFALTEHEIVYIVNNDTLCVSNANTSPKPLLESNKPINRFWIKNGLVSLEIIDASMCNIISVDIKNKVIVDFLSFPAYKNQVIPNENSYTFLSFSVVDAVGFEYESVQISTIENKVTICTFPAFEINPPQGAFYCIVDGDICYYLERVISSNMSVTISLKELQAIRDS